MEFQNKISPSKIWELRNECILIDVRSPAEFSKGHIPNAVNLPLFNDKERAIVGTAYKQISPEHALLKGLEIVGPKMSGYVKKVIKWAPNRKVLVHCWRGGKRSGSMAWLLRLAGLEVTLLEGGYKAYRQYIHQEFENKQLKVIILGGKTGSGKTHILKDLQTLGEQVIDLEGLANHKGSAFGWIGEENQPSVEQFENNLFEIFKNINPEKRVWIENESRAIGSVFIPEAIWQQMSSATMLSIEIPYEKRIAHLVADYSIVNKEALISSFQKIAKKLGQNLKKAVDFVNNDDLAAAAAIALHYYDKTYQYGLDDNDFSKQFNLPLADISSNMNAKEIINFANKNQL